MTATWQTNVLVAATPISRPARVNSTPSASRVACEPITLVIASTVAPALARLAHRRERVRGLAGLGDPDHEVAGTDDRVAVAVLGGDVHFDRHPRPFLDRVAAHQAGVVGGSAGDDHHSLDIGEDRLVERARLVQIDAVAARNAIGDRLGHGVRLFVDLLEHERLVAALLGGLLVPVDLLDLARAPPPRRASGS